MIFDPLVPGDHFITGAKRRFGLGRRPGPLWGPGTPRGAWRTLGGRFLPPLPSRQRGEVIQRGPKVRRMCVCLSVCLSVCLFVDSRNTQKRWSMKLKLHTHTLQDMSKKSRPPVAGSEHFDFSPPGAWGGDPDPPPTSRCLGTTRAALHHFRSRVFASPAF